VDWFVRVRQPDSFMVSHHFTFFPQVAIDPMPVLAPWLDTTDLTTLSG